MEPTGPKLAGNSRQFKPSTERRDTVRHRTHSPAYATLDPTQGNATDLSEILDISEDGMSIQTSSPLQPDHDLSLCLDLSETNARIRTNGRVVWSDTSGRAGIGFHRLSEQSRGQLQEWLFANVLTAVDHAQATSIEGDRKSIFNQQAISHTMPKDQSSSASSPDSDNGHGNGSQVTSHFDSSIAGTGNAGIFEDRTASETFPRDSWDRDRSDRERLVKERLPETTRAGAVNRFDRESTLQSIAERALSLTRATGAAIALSEGNDSEMACVASAGSDAPPVGARLQVGTGFSGECVRTGRSLRCDDAETDDRVDRIGCKSLGIRSMVAVPIRPGNKVAGLLEVFSAQPYAFNADDIGALQQLTGSIQPAEVRGGEAQSFAPPPKVTARTPPPRAAAKKEITPALSVPVHAQERTPVPATSRHRPLHKILLVAAIGTFVFAVLWLIAPWVATTFGSAGRSAARAQAPQNPARQSASPAGVSDLAGLRKVAEKGDPAAQFQLGVHYATGEDVKQDYTEAVRWFNLAADQGHILAQATLGAYYWAGRGVPQDLTKAYYWSVLAQAGGDQASKYRVAVLTSRMSRSQVLAAQQQADDWLRNFASHPPSSR
jgi:hypothetical protein